LRQGAFGVSHHHVGFTTHVMEDVRRFYTETLGFGEFRFDPRTDTLTVTIGPGSSLGFMPPMPGPPEQWRPPREPAICLIVEDVDRAYRELSAKGVPFVQEPSDMPWGQRTAVLRDPEGRTVMLAADIRR
jgi:catechol 2,3-dioxygenase-like lactoylglutathione lyase family enzyme